MSPSSRVWLTRLGLLLFALGVLLAFALTALLTWADVEAMSYGFPRVGNAPMRGLSCPPLMNIAEATRFSVSLKNTVERDLRPIVQVFISEPSLSRWREDTIQLQVPSGETVTHTWEIGPQDVVLNNFILVKAYTASAFPMPNTEGLCGTFVVNIPGIGGTVFYWLWFALSIILLAAGVWINETQPDKPNRKTGFIQARRVLAALAAFGLLSSYAGWWPVSIVLLVVMILILPALLFIAFDT